MQNRHDASIQLPLAFIDALSQADGVEPVLTVGAQWLPQLLPGVRGSITFIDGERLIARVARTDDRVDPRFDLSTIHDDGPRGQVLRSGEHLVLAEAGLAGSGIDLLRRLHRGGIRRMLIAPMLGGRQTVGTLSVAGPETGPYSDAQIDILIGIGKFVASRAGLMLQARNTARQAETDALTGLANRTRLMRVLDGPGELSEPGCDGRVIGVLHIDLDRFKEVNDTLGHAAGDAVLRHAAKVMCQTAAAKDLVARVGGDEFVLVTRTDPAGRQIGGLARRIAEALAEPLRIGDVEVGVGASIGTAIADRQGLGAERLIGNADIALYEVKRNGRGGVRAFCDTMRAATERRVRMLADLRHAVETRAFEPWFQPRVSLSTGAFTGVEVLARWPHPELGLVDPKEFIALSAEAGLTRQIDEVVRARGLAALRRLRADGWPMPRLSFNASAGTLLQPDLVGDLMWEVLGQGLDPQDLVVEIRESDLIAIGADAAQRSVSALAEAGFGVELDDFGAGYAAMINLARLPISAIKVDCSLTAQLPLARAEKVLRAIIALARDLELGVTAEGVETATQFSLLRNMNCAEAQGFGVAEPMPFDGLVAFMRGYGGKPATPGRRHKRFLDNKP